MARSSTNAEVVVVVVCASVVVLLLVAVADDVDKPAASTTRRKSVRGAMFLMGFDFDPEMLVGNAICMHDTVLESIIYVLLFIFQLLLIKKPCTSVE